MKIVYSSVNTRFLLDASDDEPHGDFLAAEAGHIQIIRQLADAHRYHTSH
jgi:hypothetical protein